MQLTRNSIETARGPSDWFTGTVYIDAVAAPSAASRLSASSVHFTPGARTAWHTHPNGQTIYVIEGIGRAQRRGGPVEEIRPGDRVFFEPGEEHWHGAAPDRFMTHLAMLDVDEDGNNATWGEHVSDVEYTVAPDPSSSLEASGQHDQQRQHRRGDEGAARQARQPAPGVVAGDLPADRDHAAARQRFQRRGRDVTHGPLLPDPDHLLGLAPVAAAVERQPAPAVDPVAEGVQRLGRPRPQQLRHLGALIGVPRAGLAQQRCDDRGHACQPVSDPYVPDHDTGTVAVGVVKRRVRRSGRFSTADSG